MVVRTSFVRFGTWLFADPASAGRLAKTNGSATAPKRRTARRRRPTSVPVLPTPPRPATEPGAIGSAASFVLDRIRIERDEVLARIADADRELAARIIDRYLDLVGPLAASRRHHHHHEYGLALHGLEVARAAIAGGVDSRPDFGSRDLNGLLSTQFQLAVFVEALMHDVGKVEGWIVTDEGGTKVWNPWVQTHAEFARDCGGRVAAPRPRPDVKYAHHQALGPRLMHRWLPEEIYPILSPLRIVLFSDDATSKLVSIVRKIVRQADARSCGSERDPDEAAAPRPPAPPREAVAAHAPAALPRPTVSVSPPAGAGAPEILAVPPQFVPVRQQFLIPRDAFAPLVSQFHRPSAESGVLVGSLWVLIRASDAAATLAAKMNTTVEELAARLFKENAIFHHGVGEQTFVATYCSVQDRDDGPAAQRTKFWFVSKTRVEGAREVDPFWGRVSSYRERSRGGDPNSLLKTNDFHNAVPSEIVRLDPAAKVRTAIADGTFKPGLQYYVTAAPTYPRGFVVALGFSFLCALLEETLAAAGQGDFLASLDLPHRQNFIRNCVARTGILLPTPEGHFTTKVYASHRDLTVVFLDPDAIGDEQLVERLTTSWRAHTPTPTPQETGA